jgi:hypothetical protein
MIDGGPQFLDEEQTANNAAPIGPGIPPPERKNHQPERPRGPLLLDPEPDAPAKLQSR